MVRRILTSIFAHGLADGKDAAEPVDFAASERTALAIAREGIVLLRNQSLLPLAADTVGSWSSDPTPIEAFPPVAAPRNHSPRRDRGEGTTR